MAIAPAAPKRLAWRSRTLHAVRQALETLISPQVSSAARERRDTLVLLATLALITAAHLQHLPWWASAIFWILWGWRTWLTVARRPLPGRFALVPLVVAIAGTAWLARGGGVQRDAAITFLLMLAGLKLLEMRSRRDVYVVVVLGLFLLLTQFMFDQTPGTAAVAIVATLALFYVLVSVQAVEADIPPGRKVRKTLVIALQAVPLAAGMFVFFPRIEGPLWGSMQGFGGGETGLSDTMSPGSISSLMESDRIAFRVRFGGALPRRGALYWRGPVLGDFDGRTWRGRRDRGDATSDSQSMTIDADSAVDYEVTLEPHRRTWLFALEVAAGPIAGSGLRSRLGPDLQLLAARPIEVRTRYGARSYTRFTAGAGESRAALGDWLDLPPGYNPMTLAFARALDDRRIAAGGDPSHRGDQARVDAVLDYLRAGGFHYTLTPPALGRNGIDDFLFRTRLGFCEHYAAAFVVLMRALEIPARVVTGYQGGEMNPTDGYLTVRQSDAHAWGEVWLPGRGWVRVDPTAVVEPLRVEDGIAAATGARFGATFGAAPAWLHAVRLRWEALENGWNQWLLSYSYQQQQQLMAALGFVPSWQTLVLIFSGVMIALLAVVALAAASRRERVDPLALLQRTVRRRLASAGVAVPEHFGPRQTRSLLGGRLRSADQRDAEVILAALELARYAPQSAMTLGERRLLRRRVRRFRPQRAR